METKICNKCGEDKPFCEYSIGSRIKGKIYYRLACKECERGRVRLYSIKNRVSINKKRRDYYKKERISPDFVIKNRERVAIYRAQNPERAKIQRRRTYQKNRDMVLSRNKSYYKKNKDKIIDQTAQYKLLHRERYLLMYKSYRAANRDSVIAAQRRWHIEIADAYAARLIVNQSGINKRDITPELIQLKRLEIALKRKRKEITKN